MPDPQILLARAPSPAAGFVRPTLALEIEDIALAKLRVHGPDADGRFASITGNAPPPLRRQVVQNDLTFVWLAPGEWLICGGEEAVATWLAQSDLRDDEAALALDITHGRTAFVLTGSDARDVLAAHCPLDLWDKCFRVDDVARSLLGDTTMVIARLADLDGAPRFRIVVDQSMAAYAARLLARG